MGMGRDCQSQRFLSLGLESRSSKSWDCPNDLSQSQESQGFVSHGTTLRQPEFLGLVGTRVPGTVPRFLNFLKKHENATKLQRYLSQSQTSQENQSQSQSKVPGFASRDKNPMGFKSHCLSLIRGGFLLWC